MIKPQSLKGKKWALFFGLVFLALVVTMAGAGFQALGSSSANNGGLTSPAGLSASNGVSSVQIWNGTTWEAADFTTSGNAITVTIPVEFNMSEMLIFTDNSTLDGYHLLDKSAIYQKIDVTTSDTGKMTALNSYLANYVNSSANNKLNDKRIATPAFTQNTIYSSSVNHIGKNVAMSVPAMFASLNADPQYELHFNASKTNVTGTVTFTQSFESPFSFNLFDVISGIALVIVLMDVLFLALAAIPKAYEGYSSEFGSHEILEAIIVLVVAVLEAAVVDIVLGYGLGGVLDVAIGFAIGAMLYTFKPGIQHYALTGLSGVIVGGIFAYFGAYIYTGNQYMSMLTSNELIAQLTGLIVVVFVAIMLIIGVYWTKVPDSD